MKVPKKIILLTWIVMVTALVAAAICHRVSNNAEKEVHRLIGGDTDTDLSRFIDRIEAENLPHDDATKARINELFEEHWAKVKEVSLRQSAYDRFSNIAIAITLTCFVLSIVFIVVAQRSKQ